RLPDAFVVGNRHTLRLLFPEQRPLHAFRLHSLGRKTRDLGPALHECVVGKGLLCALLSLAKRVEPVGQLACYLGLAAKFRYEFSCGTFSASLKDADEVMHHLPRRESYIVTWVPVVGELAWLEETYLASA